ncbi:MAG: helix-turn-helix transcriptional regulator [Candidatus Moraniibacteriota bacterium]
MSFERNKTNVKEARFKRNMSQDVLRLKTGINNAIISRIERGLLLASDDQKERIARALDYEIDWLFPER